MSTNNGTRGPSGRDLLQQMSADTEDRRRIARELHRSTSGLVISLQRQLGALRQLKRPGAALLIDECEQAVAEVAAHIRALAAP